MAGLEEIRRISGGAANAKASEGRGYNQSWLDALQVWDMLLICEAVVSSALERKESRGAHTRSDYPNKDDRWLANILTFEKDGKMVHQTTTVPKIPPELQALLRE